MKTLEEMLAQFADRLNVDIPCACGQVHRADIDAVLIGEGAVKMVPRMMRRKGYKTAFILADENTWQVAGKVVRDVLRRSKFHSSYFVYERGGEVLCADERAAEEGIAAYQNATEKADVVISVGTGTLNDLGKQIAAEVGVRCWNVATAASMDGFASTVAALTRENLKINAYYTPPEVIIGDTDFLRTAPREMTIAGIADMAAKYNARLDWRLSHLINDEYYCDFIADGMQTITDDIINLALEAPEEGQFPDALLERLMEGLVMSGVYMSYMGNSRAASGAEHHFSHFWEMWLQVNGKPPIYHGVKVGVGTMTMASLYPRYLGYEIPEDASRAHIEDFDEPAETEQLRQVYGAAAPLLLADYNYCKADRLRRLPVEVAKREAIDAEIRAMLPRLARMEQAMRHIGAKTRWDELPNITEEVARNAMRYCRAMRPQFTLLQLIEDTSWPIRDFEEEWIYENQSPSANSPSAKSPQAKSPQAITKDNMEVQEMPENEVLQNLEEIVETAIEPEVEEAVVEVAAEAASETAVETALETSVEAAPEKPAPKKRGRKPGSKNKPKTAAKGGAKSAKKTTAKAAAKNASTKTSATSEEAPAAPTKRRGRPKKAETPAPVVEEVKPVKKKKEELPYWLL